MGSIPTPITKCCSLEKGMYKSKTKRYYNTEVLNLKQSGGEIGRRPGPNPKKSSTSMMDEN